MVQATFVPFLLRRIAGLTRGDQHLRELFIEPAYAGKLAYVCAAACSGNVRFCRVPLGLPMRVRPRRGIGVLFVAGQEVVVRSGYRVTHG